MFAMSDSSLFVLLKMPHTVLFPPIQSLASCTVIISSLGVPMQEGCESRALMLFLLSVQVQPAALLVVGNSCWMCPNMKS